MENAGTARGILTARAAGLVGCTNCGRVHRAGTERCSRCHARLISRDTASLQRVWAWLAAGLIAYIPANIYPMLLTSSLGKTSASTIIGGVFQLIDLHEYAIAAIIFVASVLIPIGKFLAIGYLALSIRAGVVVRGHGRQHLYEVVEFIGRWSMIDVFVVAILSSLVQLKFVATINPGIAAVSFAFSVAATMLSAQSFDTRMIWDADEAPAA
ncbi:MAG: paraquat-inducible membrane protein A [Limimaricola sp.]|uniref:paraquat-inducible protein A n=1 Tax=Limimaricola sp. TaxID=2211665 RepID=UPI001DD884D9|nr:paraquat-inducible protein A [Limimaricola sp.]MBI1417307.1 paraquat-inducible membrane protein A [Limimaricola sp.]